MEVTLFSRYSAIFIFVTKYRYKVLRGDIGLKVRELIRQTCEAFEIEILTGVVSQDHIHYWYLRHRTWYSAK